MRIFEWWLVLFIFLVIVELSTVNLVSIWFAVGALVASVVSLFLDNWVIQVAVFGLVSLLILVILKPFMKKFKGQKVATNLDRVIGQIGIVTEEIQKLVPGEVKVGGRYWTATANKKIKKDTKVKVESIDGVKLVVREVKEED